MRKDHILYSLIIFSLIFFNCSKEDDFEGRNIKSRYNLQKGEDTSFQRDVYNFYNKYNSIILIDADSSDYRYNFDLENKVTVINHKHEDSVYKNALNIFNEIFIGLYGEDFLKTTMPFNIIFCDSMTAPVETKNSSKIQYVDYYVSNNFIAISGINDKLLNLSFQDKYELKKGVLLDFWTKYVYLFLKKLNIPENFIAISKDKYGETRGWLDGQFTEEDYLSEGFLVTKLGYSLPTKEIDVSDYIKLVLTSSLLEVETTYSKYPKIIKKYNILRNIFKDCFGINTDNLLIK